MAVELKKIANLLAVHETANLTKGEKARVLVAVGFSNKEAAALVGTSEASIRALLSQGRKRATED